MLKWLPYPNENQNDCGGNRNNLSFSLCTEEEEDLNVKTEASQLKVENMNT